MPRSPASKVSVKSARDLEKKYNWIAAAKAHSKNVTAALKSGNSYEAGIVSERIGFCYYRSAMQARNLQEFRKRLLQAVESYERAAELFEKSKSTEKTARKNRCKAAAIYANSLLEANPQASRKLLDECWKLQKESLRFYLRSNDPAELARTYGWLCEYQIQRLNLEWDGRKRKKMLEEVLNYEEEAIGTLSEDGYELDRAYCATIGLYYTGALGLELAKRRNYERKALDNARRALEISEKIDDYFLRGLASIWLGIAIMDFADNPNLARKHFEQALLCGKHTRDNYIIGRAFYLLTHLAAWRMRSEEDTGKIEKLSEKCEKYSREAIRHFSLISNDSEIASSYYWFAEKDIFLARTVEANPDKKRGLLEKSISLGRKGLKHARHSGSARATYLALHTLSKALLLQSALESDVEIKKGLLEESLKHREESISALGQTMPYYFWNQGSYHSYLALVQAERADLEKEEAQKRKYLEDAAKSAEKCVNFCLKHGRLSRGQHAALGGYYSDFGNILNKLYLLTGISDSLKKAVEAYKGAIEASEKANLPIHVAESFWRLADVLDRIQDYSASGEAFKAASKSYQAAANKLPRLKNFYSEYAIYMQAWSEIENAKQHHTKENYAEAKKNYERASSLHEATRSWRYLAPNYRAWVHLEQGEDSSRNEESQNAIIAFEKAAELFSEAKQSFESEMNKIQSEDEWKMVQSLRKASDVRRQYCLGRINLEKAKILDRQGDHAQSSETYGQAAKTFKKASETMEHELDQKEFRPIIYLCQAWQTMTLAEAQTSPDLYKKAAELFEKAKEIGLNERSKTLALGHSHFCRGLEAGTRFESTLDTTLHSKATRHLESAANYYVRAGFKTASEYAKATQRLFDAYVYVDKAQTQVEPIMKTQAYGMAEKLLQASANSFMKAKHIEKSEEVERLLDSVREDRQLAKSLAEVLHASTITSTTTSFPTPTATHEQAVGLEKLEHADVQANLTLKEQTVKVGEDIVLEIELVNAGKASASLVKVEEAIPSNFDARATPKTYRVLENTIYMKGKRLGPLKTERIALALRPKVEGSFALRPKIVFIDETGEYRSHEPEPLTIEVPEVYPDCVSTGLEELDNLMFGGLPENYAIVLTSPSCDERDLLIRRFLEAGIERGQATFHLVSRAGSMNTFAGGNASNFHLFLCNPKAEVVAGDLPNVYKLKGVENLTDINIALNSAFRELKPTPQGPRRVCIEIVSDVLLQHHAVQTRRWLNALLPELKLKGFTTLAVTDPGMHSPQEVNAILDLFEGEINICEKQTREGIEKLLKIKRMYNRKYSKSELSLQRETLWR